MTNKYFSPGKERAAKVRDLFGVIARRYDLINDLQSCFLHRLWKRRLVRMAAVRPGQRTLDLCCGTGDLAFALAREGAEVVGLDFTEAMLEVARDRTGNPQSAIRNPQFLRGDALLIPFLDDTFDVVTVSYGLRNLADFELGLREMWRVARPGGRLLVLDCGKPENRFWRGIFFGYLRCVVPLMGLVFCRDRAAYAYILESLKNYPGQSGVAAVMRELGCTEVRVVNFLGGMMSINAGTKPL